MVGIRAHARDRRWVAVHEAGHVVAARYYGATASGMVWPVSDYWMGCADIPGVEVMPADQRRIIGLAGAAALMSWLGVPAQCFFSMNVGVSASDWELIGDEAGLPASLAFTLDLMKRERPTLAAVSRQIIKLGRADGGPTHSAVSGDAA